MNRQEITKQYSIIFICLALISMVIMVATPFITAFELNLGLINSSETGMYYFNNIFELVNNAIKNSSSADEWLNQLGNLQSGYAIIQDPSMMLIMCVLVLAIFICAIVNTIRTLLSLSTWSYESFIAKMMFTIKTGLSLNIWYYVFCMYIIFEIHEGEISMIFSGDALVTTPTFIPIILQIIVLVGAFILRWHWSNALCGNCKPINLFGRFANTNTGFYKNDQSTYWQQNTYSSTQDFSNQNTSNQTDSTQNRQSQSSQAQFESEIIELLKRYKELFDNGVITEEEFLAKKKEIMSHNAYGQRHNTSEQQQTASNTANQNAEAPSRSCHKCGYPLTSSQQVCPHCGTSSVDEKEAEPLPMKWYKFLIYFSLFANALLNVISAIVYFTGASYGESAELIYAVFPGSQTVDLCCGVALIGLAILALYTRNALYWNKSKGPKLLCALYISNAVVSALYAFIASCITKEVLFDGSIAISLIASIAMVIVNYIYFEKRKEIFSC